MERYQCADAEAPGHLVRALSGGLLGYFRMSAATRSEAEDLLQETWLRVHRARHTYRPGEPVRPWIYAIARRTAVDGYRGRRREQLTGSLPELAQPERRGEELEFTEMVRELPEAQREVLTMLKVSGMSLEEVARATSTTVGAVKQRAFRAYESLRKRYAGKGGQ